MRFETGRAALILIALMSGALASCIDEDRIDESVQRALRQTFDRLDQTVDTLNGAVDAQRTKLAQDTQALLDTTLSGLSGITEQFRQSLDTVLAEGRNVQETITADLQHSMASISSLAEGLVAAVKASADDTIRNLVKDLERQRIATLRQINGLVQGALRPTLAQLTLVGDHFVGRFASTVNVWIVRGIGGVVIGLAVVCFVLLALKRGATRRALAVVGGVAIVAGGALVVAAAPIARIGSPEISIPSGDVVCQQMLESSAALQAALPGTKSTPRPQRIGTDLVAPRALGSPGGVGLVGKGLRSGLRAFVERDLRPGAAPVSKQISELAQAALHDASRCITYATNTQMTDLAASKFTIALALISDTLMCREPADCSPIGKTCDTSLGVCMAWGVYCDDHRDCDVSKACSNHRCVARSTVACTSPSACHPDDSCDPGSGRCIATDVVTAAHQACSVPSAVGPCSRGELQSVDRMVKCVQTTLARPEICDGMDNNCNGTIDEGLATADRCIASGQRGECANGHRVCQGGAWACVPGTPAVEACDGKDNDCDGAIDDGLPSGGACNAVAVGECRRGTMGCRNGRMECIAGAPAGEICDGKDNDCNGACDEGATCGEELVFETLDERHTLLGLREEHDYGDACGKDAYGRQRYRTRVEARDDWVRPESHCEPHDTGFGGWLNSDNTDCRVRVHFGSKADHHVRCRVKIYARPVGCIGAGP